MSAVKGLPSNLFVSLLFTEVSSSTSLFNFLLYSGAPSSADLFGLFDFFVEAGSTVGGRSAPFSSIDSNALAFTSSNSALFTAFLYLSTLFL